MKGLGISQGIAIGTAFVLKPQKESLSVHKKADAKAEIERLRQALRQAQAQVGAIVLEARQQMQGHDADIVGSQLTLLGDPAIIGEAENRIETQTLSAERAIDDVTRELYETFMTFDDEYTRERGADIRDIGRRIIRNLTGEKETDLRGLPPKTVLIAHDLAPSDTARLSAKNVCAIVTETGGKTSHAAIMARAMGIAAVTGCGQVSETVETGDTVVVNGYTGEVIARPDDAVLDQYRALLKGEEHRKAQELAASRRTVHTKQGKMIRVMANIGGVQDLADALRKGADGVGLFRTEFMFLEHDRMPTEQEQYAVYAEAVRMLEGKPLTIRTLDVGGDKALPYLAMQPEANPFLGLRAIRLCLKKPELFRTQLRAILRASALGPVNILFPMIGSVGELGAAKEQLARCKRELDAEGVPFDDDTRTGVMIEIPAAALTADELARSCDFFSIGTNDLTQYTLAVDRLNDSISDLYDPMHPAVLKLIEQSIAAARRAGIDCCMCGELASEPEAILLLLGYGLDEFSVSPGRIGGTKATLLEQTQ